MFCRNCQTIIPDDSLFCENCGAPTGLDPEKINDSNLVPEEAVEYEVVDDAAPEYTSSVPVDPVWWEPPEEDAGPIDVEITAAEPEEDEEAAEAAEDQTADAWADDVWAADDRTADADAADDWPAGDAEEADESDEAEGTDDAEGVDNAEGAEDVDGADGMRAEEKSPLLHAAELGKKAASAAASAVAGAAAQARPYAGKAKGWLEDLGKNVRTGTGWAADAAKAQLAQRREEYQEKQEERQQQRAQDRKEKDLARRRQEKLRQEERERQADEARKANADVIQQPGFWYGDEMPEPTIVIEPEADATGTAGDAAEDTIDEADVAEETTEAAEATEAVLPEDAIEDKLADTARFDWSAQQLREAAAQAAAAAQAEAAGISDAAEPAAMAEGTGAAMAEGTDAAVTEGTDAAKDFATGEGSDRAADPAADEPGQPLEEAPIVKTEAAPDEPDLYRIKDFGPAKVQKPKRDNRNLFKLLGIIAAVVVIIVAVGAAMVHQAHVRQLEEEAYQASLTQAHQLVEKEKYKKAEKAYLALIDERPEDTAPYLGLAQMYMEQQRYVDAKALIKRATKATGDKESFAQIKKDIKVLTSTKWKKAYRQVLEENESDIRKYEEYVAASVAVCDVNGDKKPELFFFTEEYYGYGKLHIYTTVDNKAKEVDYECQNRGTQYHDAFYDVNSDDSSYAIFNTGEEGKFIIYANVAHDGSSWDTTNEFELNLKGGCKRQRIMEGAIEPTYDEDEADNSKYMQDGEDISYDKYVAEFKKNLESVQDCILYNGSGGDQAVWDKITQDNVMCMSYDSMMVDLEAK